MRGIKTALPGRPYIHLRTTGMYRNAVLCSTYPGVLRGLVLVRSTSCCTAATTFTYGGVVLSRYAVTAVLNQKKTAVYYTRSNYTVGTHSVRKHYCCACFSARWNPFTGNHASHFSRASDYYPLVVSYHTYRVSILEYLSLLSIHRDNRASSRV